VLGASTDDDAANASFRAKFSFPFPLLCDTSGSLAKAYGASVEGKTTAARAAVIIGPDGKVMKWWAKVDAATFPETALNELP
jgi:peroxiredoxin Q/BCP